MNILGRYVLDTLQIFFPWDDDLYTYFKEHGLGTAGLRNEKLPLIYTDNCESTEGISERKRSNVINPKFFGMTFGQLGWKDTGLETRPIIPAEKPEIEILIEEIQGDQFIRLNIQPLVDGVNQYHLEYSSMSSFGKNYKNWATFYLPLNSALDLSKKLASYFDKRIPTEFEEETKQNQREKFRYLNVGVRRYQFSYSGFLLAQRYLELNGANDSLAVLSYDSTDPISTQLMTPILKIGIIQTKTAEGFDNRGAQVAMKLSQTQFSLTKRGVRGRAKGRIIESTDPANYVAVFATDFATKLAKVCEDQQK